MDESGLGRLLAAGGYLAMIAALVIHFRHPQVKGERGPLSPLVWSLAGISVVCLAVRIVFDIG